jgi:hypothetical protein
MIKPKERLFQVVPVPAVFNRGRWECIDFTEINGGPEVPGAVCPELSAFTAPAAKDRTSNGY